MAYFAVKGGEEAIENSGRLLIHQRTKGKSKPLQVQQIQEQLTLLVDRVMGEGSLYAPDLAALAIKQSSGDILEASFLIRAFRTTLPRLSYSIPQSTQKIKILRRISAAFKDIPGGQILGPTSDYTLRLLDFDLFDIKKERERKILGPHLDSIFPRNGGSAWPESFPKIIEILKQEGLLMDQREQEQEENPPIFDITRHALTYPASRSAVLQSLARGETGGLLLLAYSSMRGYGNVHPTIGELRVGYIPLIVPHPYNKEPYEIGSVKVTEAEIVSRFINAEGKPMFQVGYGLCFGQNEIKAISMAILDRTLHASEPKAPAENQEFVLSHVDGIEAMGFCNHWKLPHYVDFQSDLDRLRKAQALHETRNMDE